MILKVKPFFIRPADRCPFDTTVVPPEVTTVSTVPTGPTGNEASLVSITHTSTFHDMNTSSEVKTVQ